ncbi:hypothetical protein BDY19DRAFT_922753 [Irpex rosettiformis]|uniref:Uncharacterized protein n=1 Tax=Irpex rosettiformis TaxID=378272 RepID=A0ACB8UFV6_9APHY|nr:hypothetical protein BDY19DRAFT_922753 [Irpex rosettiformis]
MPTCLAISIACILTPILGPVSVIPDIPKTRSYRSLTAHIRNNARTVSTSHAQCPLLSSDPTHPPCCGCSGFRRNRLFGLHYGEGRTRYGGVPIAKHTVLMF